jgi:hypothetical protein
MAAMAMVCFPPGPEELKIKVMILLHYEMHQNQYV